MLWGSACVFILFWVINGSQGQSSCYKPFSEFMVCMKDEAFRRLDKFMLESSPSVQSQVQSCFKQSKCKAPNFKQASFDQLLPSPWNNRVHLMINLIEQSPVNVQSCMIDFFIDYAQKYVKSCVAKHGAAGRTADYFILPKLTNVASRLNIQALKSSVLNRYLVAEASISCANRRSDDVSVQALTCISEARSEGSSCSKLNECQSKIDDGCLGTFFTAKSALCSCFKTEMKKLASGQYQKQIVDLFLKGKLTSQYRSCSAKYNTPVPPVLSQVESAIKASTQDVFINGLPAQVQKMIALLITQLSEEIESLICGGTCSDKRSESRRKLRRFKSQSRASSSGGSVMSKGVMGLFGDLLNNFG